MYQPFPQLIHIQRIMVVKKSLPFLCHFNDRQLNILFYNSPKNSPKNRRATITPKQLATSVSSATNSFCTYVRTYVRTVYIYTNSVEAIFRQR